MFAWTVVDIPLLALLGPLLLASGFFSGSETALFGLTEHERMILRRQQSFASRAAQALLADQRMLLITVLLGNMTINVLYFVTSSVLLMRAEAGVFGGIGLVVISLLLIILLGEVLPKLVANARRPAFAALTAPFLLALHRLIGPLRIALDTIVVAPLSRLTSPTDTPPRLDEGELAALLDLSTRQGVIDRHEQRILHDVIVFSQRKVRDVMTPRVRVVAVSDTASRGEVAARARETRLTRFPVFHRDLDHIVGFLHVKRYLLDPRRGDVPVTDHMSLPTFVPEVATLDKLLDRLRDTRTHLAIVVDEFGGTAGIVALEDVVEELVGDIASDEQRREQRPRPIGRNRWRVGGDVSVHEWVKAFGRRLVPARVSTLGGLIMSRLGRAPVVGDTVQLGNVRVDVEEVDRARVVAAIVTLVDDDGGEVAS